MAFTFLDIISPKIIRELRLASDIKQFGTDRATLQ
jgi:hypothetical protein